VVGDPRFFVRTGPHALDVIAAACGARPERGGDRRFDGIATLANATASQVSFLDNRKYLHALRTTAAGAVVLHPEHAAEAPPGAALLLSDQPYLAWARICGLFHPEPAPVAGIHPTAIVHPSARIGEGAEIAAYADIEAGAEIGPRCRIGPHASVGRGCVIGPDCRIGAGASLSHSVLGARVFIHPGARVGQAGFGFASGPDGFITIPQLGRVVIGDDCELGANSCIDRGSAADTVIGPGTRIDNLVQIGHNVKTGRACVIVGQAGISGSTELGDFVQLGAQAGLTGHLTIGARARISAQAGVMADVPAGADMAGSPAEPIRSFMKGVMLLRRMVAGRHTGRDVRDGQGRQGGDAG
jgi:UDP-3-O-[3-hydroxymyristoyl] glucosamine N-acyltransferase